MVICPTSCCKHLDEGPDDTRRDTYSTAPETVDPDLQDASNNISLVRPNIPHIADRLVWNMRRNRSGQLARMASGVPSWPVGDPMARCADTATLCLSPAETVRPPRYGHCSTGLSGRAPAYGEHSTTGLADSILGHSAPARRQSCGHSVVDGLDLRVSGASSRQLLCWVTANRCKLYGSIPFQFW
jgi:hypothetical protein